MVLEGCSLENLLELVLEPFADLLFGETWLAALVALPKGLPKLGDGVQNGTRRWIADTRLGHGILQLLSGTRKRCELYL